MYISSPVVLSVLGLMVLSACGGGGAGSGDTPITTPPPNATPIGAIPSTVLKTLPDGTLAVQFQDNNGLAYAGFVENSAIRDVLKNLDYTITSPNSQIAQGNYSQNLVGKSGDGNEITLIANGLVDNGTSVVAVLLAENENVGRATVAVGPKPQNLPASAVQFSGQAQIFEIVPQSSGSPVETAEAGTFVLSLDFSSTEPNGTLVSRDFDNFQFAASNFTIDFNTGGFASDQAAIGRISGAQTTAQAIGQVFGSDGEAAGGVIRSTTNDPAFYTGVFYGIR